jgi:hypothetical protein
MTTMHAEQRRLIDTPHDLFLDKNIEQITSGLPNESRKALYNLFLESFSSSAYTTERIVRQRKNTKIRPWYSTFFIGCGSPRMDSTHKYGKATF